MIALLRQITRALLARRMLASLFVGAFAMWVAINATVGPGVDVIPEGEAEGPAYSDPDHLDLVSHIHRNRTCPAVTQRFVWRKIVYQGAPAVQAVPLASTVAPFLGDDGTLILTIRSDDVPDRDSGEWKYRTVTAESCPWVPVWPWPLGWLNTLVGPHLSKSPDQSVNFIGAPHEP